MSSCFFIYKQKLFFVMRIKKYGDFRRSNEQEFSKVNEEFIFGILKGALSKLFQVFAQPFKDLANDFKKLFDEKDPNSVKNIILTNFNQAVDGARKQIGPITEEAALNGIFPQMVTALINLSQNMDKDIKTGLGEDKLVAVRRIAQVIILGSQEADYPGIVGLLDPKNAEQKKICKKLGLGDPSVLETKFKYRKSEYERLLSLAGEKGALDQKKKFAMNFFNNMKKEIKAQIDKELTEEEIKNIYNKAGAEGRKREGKTTILLSWNRGDKEIELQKGEKGWMITKSTSSILVVPEDGDLYTNITGEIKKGEEVTLGGFKVNDKEYQTRDQKNEYKTGKLEKITVDGEEVQNYKFEAVQGQGEQELKNKLGELRNKEGALNRVGRFADFLANADEDKIKQVQNLMSGGAQGGGGGGAAGA